MGAGMKMIAGIGRMLVSVMFLVMGVGTIFNWEMTVREFSGALANWELAVSHVENVNGILGFLSDNVQTLLGVGVGFQIIGGLFLFFSYRVRFGAFLLLLYLILATALYHHFWFLEGPALARSLVLFLKNLAIMGGLIIIIAMGKGKVRVLHVTHKSHDEEEEFEEE